MPKVTVRAVLRTIKSGWREEDSGWVWHEGTTFVVKGVVWGDGLMFFNNPKPKKYKFHGLAFHPDAAVKGDEKRLYWSSYPVDIDALEELSPFRIASIVYNGKQVTIRGQKRKGAAV